MPECGTAALGCVESAFGVFQPRAAGLNSLEPAQIGALPPRQAFFGKPLEDPVFDPLRLAIVPFLGTISILVDDVHVRLDSTDFRLGVQPALAR